MSRNIFKLTATLVLTAVLLLISFGKTFAQKSIESDNYRIQFPNFNSGAGIPSSSNYRLDSTIGQTAPGLYSSSGYKVRAGFQYIHSIIPFSFAISDFLIDFGTLTTQSPTTQTNTLTVSSGGAGAYSVKAEENEPLTTLDGSTSIPDTTCDASCTETSAGVWIQNTTYGFGFNVSGDDVPGDFIDGTYYRQFSDASLSEAPATVMASSNVGRGREATITYKVNVSTGQPGGIYQNIITYVAIPGF